jgi:L-lactate dehydrogenase complex protein LldG
MASRENILKRIRAANGRSAQASVQDEQIAARRLRSHDRGPLPTMDWDPLERFRDRCEAMLSTVDEIETLADLPAAVARYLTGLSLPTTGVCWREFAELPWQSAGLSIDARPSNGDDKVGITGSFCAIAETGSLMMLSGEQWHATTSLLPETHIAVVRQSRVLRAMEDGWDLLRREHGSLPRQVNFISGPSRTADIEMTLVMGAHGPFRVHVVLLKS